MRADDRGQPRRLANQRQFPIRHGIVRQIADPLDMWPRHPGSLAAFPRDISRWNPDGFAYNSAPWKSCTRRPSGHRLSPSPSRCRAPRCCAAAGQQDWRWTIPMNARCIPVLFHAPVTKRAASKQREPDWACPLPGTRRGLYAHFESTKDLHRPGCPELAPEAP